MRTILLDRFGYQQIQTGGMQRKAMVFVVRSTWSFRDRLGIPLANAGGMKESHGVSDEERKNASCRRLGTGGWNLCRIRL
jgi:hypothetical protein